MNKKMIPTEGMIVPIVVILVIVAIGIFGFSYYQKGKVTETATDSVNINTVQTNTETPATPTTVTNPASSAPIAPVSVKIVTLNDSGFSPASTEVKAGETVKFINDGSGKMWVASAPHPTHTNYSEFDEKAGVDNGGSYEFIFLKTGSWKYHNHLNPSQFGTIVVK